MAIDTAMARNYIRNHIDPLFDDHNIGIINDCAGLVQTERARALEWLFEDIVSICTDAGMFPADIVIDKLKCTKLTDPHEIAFALGVEVLKTLRRKKRESV